MTEELDKNERVHLVERQRNAAAMLVVLHCEEYLNIPFCDFHWMTNAVQLHPISPPCLHRQDRSRQD